MRQKLICGIAAIVFITVLMVSYAAYLNQLFYANYAPFYDSSGYLINLLTVIQLAQAKGLSDAFAYAVRGSGPATLPFIEATLLAPFISHPTRYLAPLLQLPWLASFAGSLFFYFSYFQKKSLWLSLALTLPFISIAAFWQYNGGLSDFRMDLYLYILLGTTFTWFLGGRYSTSNWPWILTGVFLGLTCLSRVTAPVYAFLCLTPLILLRLLFKKGSRKKVLIGTFFTVISTLLISAWFYAINFENFYHYYFIWNTDANAKLPLVESIQHFDLAFQNLGPYALSIALIFFFLGCFRYWLQQNRAPDSAKSFISFLGKLDWESLWLGIAPILFLVLRGAGLNPLVVMPAAFGLIMFSISLMLMEERSDRKTLLIEKDNLGTSILYSAVFLIFIFSGIAGIENHVTPDQGNRFKNMRPQQELIEMVDKDLSETVDLKEVIISTTYISSINNTSLENVLKFNYPELASKISFPLLSYPPRNFNRIQSASDWESTPGNNDSEKIDYLVNFANQDLNYVILPDDSSIAAIKPKYPYVIVNRHADEIKKRLLQSGKWKTIGTSRQVDHDEIVQIYRNELKTH